MRRQSDLNDIYGVRKRTVNPLDPYNDVPESGFRHSDSYHRYFRGYTEIRREQANGRYRIERYYTQPWIVSTASCRKYWMIRFVYGMLVGFSWVFYLWATGSDLASNRSVLAAIPGLPSVIFLVLLSAVTINYIFACKKMTLWEHESSTSRLKVMSLLTGGSIMLTALCKLIYALMVESMNYRELLSIGAALTAGACAAAVFGIERKAVYTTVPNDTVLPEGEAHEIW